MTTNILTYLTFNGNCREAMTFYKDCIGGQLIFQAVGESPMADKMPPQMKESILHSTLTKNGTVLILASDMVSSEGLIKGNNITLCLHCSSEEEIKNCYTNLSGGGNATYPLEITFWNAIFGGLIDKYGNYWLLNFEKPAQ